MVTFLGWTLSAPLLNAVYVPAEGYSLSNPSSWGPPSWQADDAEDPEPFDGPDQTDTDDDGLPNWFEDWYELLHSPAGWQEGSMRGNPDADYDGATDHEEIVDMQSDPFDPYSLGIFQNDGTTRVLDGIYWQATLADSDGDGLKDWDEQTVHGTDPNDGDSDDDGWGDGDEIAHGSPPTDPDSDDDGIMDLDDYTAASDPWGDSDGDGLQNHFEATTPHSLPGGSTALSRVCLYDTDGDGLSDGYELQTEFTYGNGETVYKAVSNPVMHSTDQDGYADSANSSYVFPSETPPGITIASPESLGTAEDSSPYSSEAFIAQNASGTVTWSVSEGNLPSSIEFQGNVLVGYAPAGVYTFSVQAMDQSQQIASKDFTLVVTPPALRIASDSNLPEFQEGESIIWQFAASGGSGGYLFSSPGTLPGSLSLDSSGFLVGSVSVAGSYDLEVVVTDSNGTSATQTATLTISTIPPPSLTITSSETMSDAHNGQPYIWRFDAAGGVGSLSWSILNPDLPAGLEFISDADSGEAWLTGTPVAATPGSYVIEVRVDDANGNYATQNANLTMIDVPPPPIEVAGPYDLTASIWSPLTHTFTSTGGVGDFYHYTLDSGSNLPEGFQLSSSGVLTGQFTEAGSYFFSISVSNGASYGNQAFTLNVVDQDADGDGLMASMEHELAIESQLPLHDASAISNAGVDVTEGANDWFVYYEYRLRALDSEDVDGDGLGACLEARLGTSDTAKDSNDDMRPDWWNYYEAWHAYRDTVDVDGDGLHALLESFLGTSDSMMDSDLDTLPDDYECQYISYSDPAMWDTDADGLDDGRELTALTQARWVDTDGDFITDHEEVENVFQVTPALNPNSIDSDDDGYPDWLEVQLTDSDAGGIPDKLEDHWGLDKNDLSDENGDLDGDYVNNLTAYLNGWNVRARFDPLFDRDHDGMTNLYELARSFDPDDSTDGADDPDGDWLTNTEEFSRRTGPLQQLTTSEPPMILEIDQATGLLVIDPQIEYPLTYVTRPAQNDYETCGVALWHNRLCADGVVRPLERGNGAYNDREYDDDWDGDGRSNHDELCAPDGRRTDPRVWDRPLTFNTGGSALPEVGVPYSLALVPQGGLPPFTFALAEGSGPLPAGLSIGPFPSAPAEWGITGTPTTEGDYPISIKLTDFRQSTITSSWVLSVKPKRIPLVIASTGINQAMKNQPYSGQITTTGGNGALYYSVTGLPEGLTVNPATGLISGTPAASGSFGLTISVMDSWPTTVTQFAVLNVGTTTDLKLTRTNLSSGQVTFPNVPYSVTYLASDGLPPYSFTLAPNTTLPPGITHDGQGGFSGRPTNQGAWSITLNVSDSNSPPLSVSTSFSIAVVPPWNVPNPDPDPLPLGLRLANPKSQFIWTPGSSFSITLTGAGGPDGNTDPYLFEVTADHPDWTTFGLSYDPLTHVISSSQQPSSSSVNPIAFSVTITKGEESVVENHSIYLASPLHITAPPEYLSSSPTWVIKNIPSSIAVPLSTSSPFAPVTWKILSYVMPSVPPGTPPVSTPTPPMITAQGEVNQAIPAVGEYYVTVEVKDGTGRTATETVRYGGTLYTGPTEITEETEVTEETEETEDGSGEPLTIQASDISGFENQDITSSVGASGGRRPYTFSGSGAGLSVSDLVTGEITGTLGSKGTYSMNLTVIDAKGASKSKQITVTVGEEPTEDPPTENGPTEDPPTEEPSEDPTEDDPPTEDVRAVALYPPLYDEDGEEIEGSTEPVDGEYTLLVENNPGIDPDTSKPIAPDASRVRVAWRDILIHVPPDGDEDFHNKKATWSFTPIGNIRGDLQHAVDNLHRTTFSASDQFNYNLKLEGTVAKSVIRNGRTAIRVNVPPIGFNKGTIKVSIEDGPQNVEVARVYVPAVIVIDPGHGGNSPKDSYDDSSYNNARGVLSEVYEKDMTLDYGWALSQSLITKLDAEGKIGRIFMTRRINENIQGIKRAEVAGRNGADVFCSIHFNAANHASHGSEALVRAPDNVNTTPDEAFARRVLDGVLAAMPNKIDRGVKNYLWSKKEQRNVPAKLAALSDQKDGYNQTSLYSPIVGTMVEIEFIDVPAVDTMLNIDPGGGAIRVSVTLEMAKKILEEIQTP